MFGIPTDLIQLFTNKDKLAEKIKAEAPAVLEAILALIAQQCGAQDGQQAAVVFYQGKNAAGEPTPMARTHAVDAFGDLGEELGSIDLPAALKAIPNSAITSMLPW